jgi:hypothetical protein
MSEYQTLSNYSGSLYGHPQYNGIEYDWEVPDNLVVGSPGGVSTIHHHYTKGFDGRGNTSSDIYAGQADRYISGIYGNLYQTGQEAGQNMGYYPAAPDYQYWQNQQPSQYSYTHGESSMWDPSMMMYGEPGAYQNIPDGVQKKALNDPYSLENYTTGDLYDSPYSEYRETEYDSDIKFDSEDFELLQQADVAPIQQKLQEIDNQLDTIEYNQKRASAKAQSIFIPGVPPWILFGFFLLAFIVFSFWTETAHLFVRQKYHAGGDPPWQLAVIYAILATFLFVLLIWLADIPISTFE